MRCLNGITSRSGLPFPSPEDLLNPGTEPAFPALSGRFSTTAQPGKPLDAKTASE